MYRSSFRLFLMPTAFLAAVRIVLKLLFIDTTTGFYSGGSILPTVYTVVTVVSLAAVLFSVKREKDAGMDSLRGNRALEIAGEVFGVITVIVSALSLVKLFSEPFTLIEINVLPRPMRLVCYVLGVISGAVLLWTSMSSVSGARKLKKAGTYSLFICVWHALYLVDRFMTFREVSTVSDQLLETLYLLCSVYFWLGHAKCIAESEPPRKRVILSALSSAILGVPLAAGQLAAVLVFGDVSGPSLSQTVIIAAGCVYFVLFARAAAMSREKDAEE